MDRATEMLAKVKSLTNTNESTRSDNDNFQEIGNRMLTDIRQHAINLENTVDGNTPAYRLQVKQGNVYLTLKDSTVSAVMNFVDGSSANIGSWNSADTDTAIDAISSYLDNLSA